MCKDTSKGKNRAYAYEYSRLKTHNIQGFKHTKDALNIEDSLGCDSLIMRLVPYLYKS